MAETEIKSSSKAFVPLLAGVLGGTVSTITLYPLDLIKVRLQVNEDELAASARGKRLNSCTVFRAVLRHEGVAGLYQGLSPAVIGSGVSWGGYLFLYEAMKRRYGQYKDPTNTSGPYYFNAGESFALACSSGAVLVGLTNPIWLIKTRMQLQMTQTAKSQGMKAPYTGIIDAARTIVREEGAAALYKGAGPALMLTSHGGVQFMVYEYLKQYFQFSRAERDPSMSVSERFQLSLSFLAMGAGSKIIASTVTYPLQVIKSRLQQRAESLELTSTGDVRVVKRDYGGVINTIGKMWQQERAAGFFKGAIPNAIRVAPGAAITFFGL